MISEASCSFFRDRRQEQDVFERPVKSFDHGDATMFANGAEPRQDAPQLTPVLFEVLALELAPLIDNQMFWLCLSLFDNSVQCCRDFLRRWPSLEYCKSHGTP